MSAHDLGQAFHHQVGAEIERSTNRRTGERIIDEQPGAGRTRERRQGRDIGHAQQRIRDRLGHEQPGFRRQRRADRAEVANVDDGALDAQARAFRGEQDERTAIKLIAEHHMIAGGKLRKRSHGQSRHARGADRGAVGTVQVAAFFGQ